MDQKEALRRYRMLVDAVKAAIDAADPIGLRKTGAPGDEYQAEVGTIVPRVTKASDAAEVQKIVLEEFERWVGPVTAGTAGKNEASARNIWQAGFK